MFFVGLEVAEDDLTGNVRGGPLSALAIWARDVSDRITVERI